MEDRRALLDFTRAELEGTLREWDQPGFRAGQVFAWLHKGVPFGGMSDLPQSLRERLAMEYLDLPATCRQVITSGKDGTVKFLFACADGNLIEGVLMRYHYGYSLCISTQVGCRMGCLFCASALGGCVRDLSAGEMLSQVILANRFLGEQGRTSHVVLMGSGEPLANYDQTVRFLRLVSDRRGLHMSLRNISLSTCGLVPEIRRLAGEGLPVTLCISLHGPNDGIRGQIMPIARRYSLQPLMAAVRAYIRQTGRRVIFEYALIDGLNSDASHARELARLVAGIQCHVNIIPLNPVPERRLSAPGPEQVRAFLRTVENLGISVTCRREMGADIGGACGQLRRRHLKSEAKVDRIGEEKG